jgi:hypothetical protein
MNLVYLACPPESLVTNSLREPGTNPSLRTDDIRQAPTLLPLVQICFVPACDRKYITLQRELDSHKITL